MRTHRWTTVVACVVLAGGLALVSACGSAGSSELRAFATPDDGVKAMAEVLGTGDMTRFEQIFGADGVDILRSGDDVADRELAMKVKAAIEQKVVFKDRADGSKVALFGNEGWPFPVPLARGADGWTFDVPAGREEIENRRVGRNELFTIATLHEFVEAQREYAAEGRDGKPRAFAQKVVSTEGRHDGLYWQVAAGEPASPFGPEVAAAAAEGYRKTGDAPIAFHGYHYRPLTAQGASAPGGAKSYLNTSGLMTGGFAAVAWPAKYGNSGVMTFLVNRQGIVFQKDLGENTASAVSSITAYDPDATWEPVTTK